MSEPVILKAVQDQYGAVARSGLSNESAAIRSVAQAFGYSEEDLASLPPEANMGLSCGNPIALAGLRPERSSSTLVAVAAWMSFLLRRKSDRLAKRLVST